MILCLKVAAMPNIFHTIVHIAAPTALSSVVITPISAGDSWPFITINTYKDNIESKRPRLTIFHYAYQQIARHNETSIHKYIKYTQVQQPNDLMSSRSIQQTELQSDLYYLLANGYAPILGTHFLKLLET